MTLISPQNNVISQATDKGNKVFKVSSAPLQSSFAKRNAQTSSLLAPSKQQQQQFAQSYSKAAVCASPLALLAASVLQCKLHEQKTFKELSDSGKGAINRKQTSGVRSHFESRSNLLGQWHECHGPDLSDGHGRAVCSAFARCSVMELGKKNVIVIACLNKFFETALHS